MMKMELEVEVNEDSDEIRHDIENIDVKSTYPCLPRNNNTWLTFDNCSKKRLRYLYIRDNVAYQKLLKDHKIDFKPSKLITLSPSDRMFILFEEYIALHNHKLPPSSITPFRK